MINPFKPKRTLKEQIKYELVRLFDGLNLRAKRVPSRRVAVYCLRQKSGKFLRHARYFFEDSYFQIRRLSVHTEGFLFSAILAISVFMFLTYEASSAINTLIAILLLVLIAVIYSQLKMQRRMMRQYVPTISMVRIRKCRLFSDRIRVLNLYGVKEKLADIGRIRNIEIAYDIINDSYSPVSVEGVSLTVRLRKGKRISLPTSVSIVDAEPKKTSGTDVTFRLRNPVDFDSIEWLELELKGNCKKKVRIRPHLYVNIMLREKVPKFIKEPFAKFRKRPEIAEM